MPPPQGGGQMALSVWLRAAAPTDEGLLVPGRPHRTACDLLLAPDGAHLVADELDVVLRYDDCGGAEGDHWFLTSWSATRGGDPIGAAARGIGCYAEEITQVRRRRRPFSTWIHRFGRGARKTPLYAARTINYRVDADLSALAMLCATLAHKPDWRPQLADPDCTRQLLQDMAATDHRMLIPKTGATRRSMETLIALQLLGFEHRLGGRPLPDDPPLKDEAVVDAVLQRLRANHYALPPDEAQVSALVHRQYLDVEPWPFAALMPTQPGPPAQGAVG